MKTEEKKVYHAPQLVVYGAVTSLTAGGSGASSETAWNSANFLQRL